MANRKPIQVYRRPTEQVELKQPADPLERRKPPTQTYRDLPIAPVSYWETVGMVKRALDELERGIFRSAAHLVDAMGRDDRITGVLATRVNGLLGLPLQFDPPDGEDAPPEQTQLAEGIEKVWPRIAPEADLEDLDRWGLMLGFGLAENVWELGADAWTPKLKVWHPSQIYWDWDKRVFWVNTQSGRVEIPEQSDGKWTVYAPYGYQRGWMRGAVRALSLPWLVRGFARRDWAHHSEQHGQGVKVGNVPITAPEEERKKFIKALSQLGTDTTIECPMLPDGTKFGIELVEAKSLTWEGFKELLGHADTAIAIVLLGQNLTTEGGGDKGGAYALGKVHDQVRKDFQQADARKLGRSLQDGVLRPYALYNAGDDELAPFPCWQTEPPEDTAQKADSLQKVGTFLTAAKTAAAPVDMRALLEKFEVPLLTPEQEQQQKAEAAKAAAAAQAAFQQRGAPGDEKPDDEEQQLTARDRIPASARRGQAYVDRLTETSTEHAAQALDTDLQVLLNEVRLATSPADLRQRLVRAYSGMRLQDLVTLVGNAQLLAELAGQRSVLEEF